MKCGGFTDDGQRWNLCLSRWSQNFRCSAGGFRCTLVYRSRSSCAREQSPMPSCNFSPYNVFFLRKISTTTTPITLTQSPKIVAITNPQSPPSTRSLSVAQPNAAAHTKVQGSTRIVRAARVPRFHAFSCDPCIETCRKSFFPTPMSAMHSLVVMANLRFSIEGLAGC